MSSKKNKDLGENVERIYSDYIHKSRYARYVPEEHRRETWEETVGRYVEYFRQRTKGNVAQSDWKVLEHAILHHDIMPS